MTDEPEPLTLVCVECREVAPPDARGWRTYLTIDNEPGHFCPECAEREFEDELKRRASEGSTVDLAWSR